MGTGLRVTTAALLVLALALIAACGEDDDTSTDTSNSDSAPGREFEQDETGGGQNTGTDGQQPPEGKGPNVGDHGETGTATFSGFPAGLKIRILGGGGGTSNCTRDESDISFTTSGKDEQHRYSFIAKSTGGCGYELSWSNFKVEVRDPSQGDRVIATGNMWLGQPNPVYGYKADCDSGAPPKRSYSWDRMKCEHLQGQFDLKVSPGAKLREGAQ